MNNDYKGVNINILLKRESRSINSHQVLFIIYIFLNFDRRVQCPRFQSLKLFQRSCLEFLRRYTSSGSVNPAENLQMNCIKSQFGCLARLGRYRPTRPHLYVTLSLSASICQPSQLMHADYKNNRNGVTGPEIGIAS